MFFFFHRICWLSDSEDVDSKQRWMWLHINGANSASSPVILESPSVSFTDCHVRALIKPMAACSKTEWAVYRYSGVENTHANCHPAHAAVLPYESHLLVTWGPAGLLWPQHHDNLIAHPPLGEIHQHWRWSVMYWNEGVMKSSVWHATFFPLHEGVKGQRTITAKRVRL